MHQSINHCDNQIAEKGGQALCGGFVYRTESNPHSHTALAFDAAAGMSHYPCTAYCPWNTLANRDMQSCLCYDLSYHREVPSYLNPMRTRPVLLKPPVLPLAVPRLAIKREIRKEETQRRTDKTFLKFGIDSILNGKTGSSKPSTEQATNYRGTYGVGKSCL